MGVFLESCKLVPHLASQTWLEVERKGKLNLPSLIKIELLKNDIVDVIVLLYKATGRPNT